MKKMRLIEEYLDGSLSAEEKKNFEDRLGKDKELADLVKMHLDVNESIRDDELHALREKLKEIGEKYFRSKKINK